ncbi:MAG: DUF3549 family protein [Chromatiales bacterium]|jgi:hypothetical protein
MTKPQISTLFEFLETGGLAPCFYDMGRRILPLSKETFLSFERTETPYPQALQQQAWLGLVLQTGADPVIWFLRFPLDEQGKLLQAARDDFMFQLMERLGTATSASEQQRTQIESALEQSPYAFQPKQERLAAFHARLTVALAQPPSHYYAHAKRYFSGELGWDQWSFIGYQGIADIAARHAEEGNDQRLAAAIAHLPATPLEALCHLLENECIPPSLAQALLDRARATLESETTDPQVITATLRGISFSVSRSLRRRLLKEVLHHPIAQRSDILAAIAGRLWTDLEDADLRGQFLEQLAANEQGQSFFDQLLADLLFLAECRPGMLQSLRNPMRSETLSQAIGAFFSRIKPA